MNELLVANGKIMVAGMYGVQAGMQAQVQQRRGNPVRQVVREGREGEIDR